MVDQPPAAGGAGGQPQQPPFGQTPVTASTPNKGYEAAALQKLGVIVKQLEPLLALLGSSSEPGQAVLKAINSLAKFVPPGSVTPAQTKNVLDSAQMQNTQNNAQMQALRQRMMQGGQQGAAPPQMPPRAA